MDGKLRRSRRALLLGVLSSGFLTKMALGAVAVAAVGGVAVTMPRTVPTTTTETPATSLAFVETAPAVATNPVEPAQGEPSAAEALAQRAHDFAGEMRAWGDCVAVAARAHSGGAFDPMAECGETPSAADHGLGKAQAPGQLKNKPEKSDKPDNPNKPEKSDKPDNSDKPEQVDE